MAIDIQRVSKDRMADLSEPISVVFGLTPSPERTARARGVPELDTLYAGMDGDAIVGTAGAFCFELTVPGRLTVETSGVTLVAVLPTHRRQGILTSMMRRHLDDARARGQAIAALFASEGGIYGRFGYGMAALRAQVEIRKERTAFAKSAQGGPAMGPVRLVGEEEAARSMPLVWESVRRARPGMLSRTDEWWRVRRLADPPALRAGRPPLQRALLAGADGTPAAYALYRMSGPVFANPGGFGVEVMECLGSTPEATRAMWQFLFSMDLTRAVRAILLPVDHPLTFMLAEPAALQMRLEDGIYVRLIDVGAALSRRAYRDGPPIVFDVKDAFCPWNTGRWRLAEGVATRTDAAAHLALDAATLGAAYLGAFSFSQLALAGRVTELAPHALVRGDALFGASVLPWCPEIF